MEAATYLAAIRTDSDRLVRAAVRDLHAPVACCPGWTVRDVVEHLAVVYLDKIAQTRLLREPSPWPPPAPPDPIKWLTDARDDLVDLFARLGPAAPSHTWHAPDQTVGFWLRRMAMETTVHAGDVTAAFGERGTVDMALAVDGIDEVLEVMLAGDWSDAPQPGPDHQVRLLAGGRSWLISLATELVTVDRDPPPPGPAEGVVEATASDVFLWLWRRLPDEAVGRRGDQAAVARLRDWMGVVTD
ncbi:maleylpyruvate isomerase family mycothiol-dependent enzyme [Micromonospora marina]|uniref:TIGR03083 family protein n=1 Tax=Micromonospora marina TaxID=307120 RepID=A0A1C4ZM45_9ACTN|nr:maleylpyruvate isomerase family mycothiol-dependent enzyme [Micromonospora marina]SCF33844.1 TIGR03083 family protein [Micromonospora marina]